MTNYRYLNLNSNMLPTFIFLIAGLFWTQSMATLITATDVIANGSIDNTGRVPGSLINGLSDPTTSISLPGGSSDALGNYRQDTTGINEFGANSAWAIRGDVTGGTQDNFSNAWAIIDLGADFALDGIDIFQAPLGNSPSVGQTNRSVRSADIFYASSANALRTVDGAGLVTIGGNVEDQQFGTSLTNELIAFDSTGFTFAGSVTFPTPLGNETAIAPMTINLANPVARYIAITNLTSADADDVSVGEIQAFTTVIPEPSTIGLVGLAIALLSIFRCQRKQL